MGLDRMEEFLDRAGLRDAVEGPRAPRYLHVTGTNGKGSVTAFMEAILTAHGVRAGGYYSPFVFDPCERITVGCEKISPADFAARIEALQPAGESLCETAYGGVTEFEVKTAAGFLHWYLEGCRWVALEVGLGGRLDATNVVRCAAAAIVSIGLDHTNILGDTLEAIAYEKAGIIKQGRPVVIGEVGPEARRVLEREACERNAPVWGFGEEVVLCAEEGDTWAVEAAGARFEGLAPGLRGARAPHNLAVAIGTLVAAGFELEPDAVRRGAAEVRLPGRMQSVRWRGVEFLLDGAHNGDAARALAEGLALRYPGREIVLVLGMTRGHDPREFVGPLEERVRSVHLAPIDFHRALPPEEVASALSRGAATVHGSVPEALAAAADEAGPARLVVVTGSFYLVGEAGVVLGLTPSRIGA